MNNGDVIVRVGADITAFSRGMTAATANLTQFGNANRETFDAFKKVGTAFTAGGVAIAAGLGASVKVASDFQSAFAGVRKTVDATEEEFAVLKDGIRDMAKELPAGADEIARVTEAAGQLGIKKNALLDFTRVMVNLGVATNMSADDAATALARFANITNMSQTDFSNLGSTVVDLGNKFATTEGEIVDMALRLAGAGAQIGMSEADIMGLSAALSSVGVQAEMGGSALSKAMVNMQVATSTGFGKMNDITAKTGLTLRELQLSASNTPKHFTLVAESLDMTKTELNNVIKSASDLENFAKIAGMTGGEFKKAFETDAVGALGAFIEGLGGAEAAGDSAINMLQEMGITEVRLRDSLLRAGNASELFAGAIDIANNAWTENVALTNEAEERYKTFESKLAMFKNVVTDVAISVGDVLLPVITSFIEKLSGLADWISNLNPKIIEASVIFTAIAGAVMLVVGPILLLIGFIPQIITGFKAITTVFAATKAAILGLATGVGPLSAAFTFLTGPVGIAIAAITGIIAVLVLAYNKVEWFRDGVDKVWAKIKELTVKAFGAVKDTVTKVIKDTVSFASGILDKFKAFWDENGKAIMAIVKLYFGAIMTQIKLVMGLIKGVFEVVWPLITAVIDMAWRTIKAIVSTAINIVLGTIQTVLKVLQGDWKGAWETIKSTVSNIWNDVKALFKPSEMTQIGKDIISGLINGIGSMASAVGDAAKNIAKNVKDTITGFLGIKSPSRVLMAIGVNTGEGFVNGIKSMTSEVAKQANKLAQAAIIDSKQSIAIAGYQTPVSGAGAGRSAVSTSSHGGTSNGAVINQTLHFHDHAISPSEAARKQKQASQHLALEWGMG